MYIIGGMIYADFKYMNREKETLAQVAYLYGVISRGGSLYDDLSDEMSESAISQYVEQQFPGALSILRR